MPRIYTEIRIAHESTNDKLLFEMMLDNQAKSLGFNNRADYIRLITYIDSASGIIDKLKSEKDNTGKHKDYIHKRARELMKEPE
jgi:uncharacterized protein YeeX (DUF496 family)